MGTQLLNIQPCELQFVFELKKQSSCTIQLLNKSNHHVAFKVKTTSPKKYCVRPNVGVIMPKSASEFTVTMQAQRSAPPDMSCKDKFLVQSTIVPSGTSEEDITAAMFSKEGGKFIQENKLKVSLVSPSNSPVPSPVNGTLKQERNEAPALMDQGLTDDDFLLEPMVGLAKSVNPIKVVKVKDEESPQEDARVKSIKMVKLTDEEIPQEDAIVKSIKVVKVKDEENPQEDARVKPIKVVKDEESPHEDARPKLEENNLVKVVVTKDMGLEPYLKPKLEDNNSVKVVTKDMGLEPYSKDVRFCMKEDTEDANLVKDIEEMKLKLSGLESKLSKAEVTISKLREEGGLNIQERQVLNEELVVLRSRKGTKMVHSGFPLLFVVMVALVSFTVGYLLH